MIEKSPSPAGYAIATGLRLQPLRRLAASTREAERETEHPLFAFVEYSEGICKRNAEMGFKYALATTSVLALLAGPALAQAPAAKSDPAAHPGAPAAGGSNITVQQPAPAVTVKPSAPDVNVQAEKPNVTVTQPPPQVIVKNPAPNVQVQTAQPEVKVLPAGKPDVTVNQAPGKPDVNVGSTAAPNASATGNAAVAPAAGTYPAAKEVEKYIGKDVYGANGKKVGELNNVLIDPDGKVRAGVIAFGGFLGIGEHRVAVPWNDLNAQGDRLTVNMTDDQIKAAPTWNKDKPTGQFAEYKPYR